MKSHIHDQSSLTLVEHYFNVNGVVLIKNLFPPEDCISARDYIINNEHNIIHQYGHDKVRLVSENSKSGTHQIKYFENPLSLSRSIFGRFVSSTCFELAQLLLNDDVFLFSLEIHSRFPGSTSIPPHQDNAYYGLEQAKGLTFYTVLDHQSFDQGGLNYFSYNVTGQDLLHINSSAPGFSLEIKNKDVTNTMVALNPIYAVGDTTIHHSRSLHYASAVPLFSSRSIVIRSTFLSLSDQKKTGHEAWYATMIDKNRSTQ